MRKIQLLDSDPSVGFTTTGDVGRRGVSRRNGREGRGAATSAVTTATTAARSQSISFDTVFYNVRSFLQFFHNYAPFKNSPLLSNQLLPKL